jgi:hypothetical protein
MQPPDDHYDGVHCNVTIGQLSPRVLVLRISGTDIGEFGDAPMRSLEGRLGAAAPARLFIDARDVRGASIEVSGEWARWLGAHRKELDEIHMLTGSRFVEVTAGFVRRFSALEGVMRIYTEPAVFDAVLRESV